MQFIDLAAQQKRIRVIIEANIQAVLSHGKYIMGSEVKELETRLAKYVSVKHAIGCASGTDALLIALMTYNIGPGDAIFTTPFTFFSTAEVISLLGATPIFVDIDPLKLSFALPEKFSGQLKIGQVVEVETKAYPGKIFTGNVYFISPKVNLNTRTFEVKAKLENQNYQLKPGFFVDVKLFLDVNERAMVLPEGAVIMREGRYVVLMVQEGKITIKDVRPGKRFNGKVEILDGVDKDDRIVVSGLGEFVEGSRVKVVDSKP